ncbi:MAG: DNA recombination/repair protein RecA [Pyrinomonadaceae bacterium]|nr:DNA recombination/repair protein RecA [Pyrinomonadaceae bacterium]
MRAAISKAEIESEVSSRFATAFKLQEKPPVAVVSTGILEVDSLTGGLPRGAITEIFGPASSGRTSFMISALAYATTHEEVGVLIDTSDTFDPISAAEAGLNLERLLWIRCAANVEHAFKATDLLLQGGGFGIVVLDIGDLVGADARRIISSWWYRFRRVVENTPTALLVIAEDSCVRSCASLALKLNREVDVWSSVSQTSFNRPSLIASPRRLTNDPTHSSLISRMEFQISRQKPVHLGAGDAQFRARAQ